MVYPHEQRGFEFEDDALIALLDDDSRMDSTVVDDTNIRTEHDAAVQHGQLDAPSRAFNIPELLEQFLSPLSALELKYNAQPTCQRFKNIIENSPTLRRKTFLDPDTSMAPQLCPYLYGDLWYNGPAMYTFFVVKLGDLMRPNLSASLLIQPPVSAVLLRLNLSKHACPWEDWEAMTVENEGGVRIGDAASAVAKAIRRLGGTTRRRVDLPFKLKLHFTSGECFYDPHQHQGSQVQNLG